MGGRRGRRARCGRGRPDARPLSRLGSIGVLVVNLGSPEAPTTRAVRRYLREFLGDPRVLDMNPIGRALLLNLVILPFRPRRSARAYQKIWTPEGSPLVVHGHALVEGLSETLGEGYEVVLAMRYGRGGIAEGLAELDRRGCDQIVLFPLYPQYASSTTGTALEVAYAHAAQRWNTPFLRVVPPFFAQPGYVGAVASVSNAHLSERPADHVLFSFHGLPERHIRRGERTPGGCLNDTCCTALTTTNRSCYRAQCMASATLIAERMGLEPSGYSVSFQSRLGRAVWIAPYTTEVIKDLAKAGVKRLAVLCPAFAADCLETLEEIGMEAAEDFVAAGGEALSLVPALNAHPVWVEAAAELVRETAGLLPV